MFVEILRGILYQHAAISRAVTVEEYKAGVVWIASRDAEYIRLCAFWSEALKRVDPDLMTITPDIYEFLELMGILSASYSEWEVTDESEEVDRQLPHPAIIRP